VGSPPGGEREKKKKKKKRQSRTKKKGIKGSSHWCRHSHGRGEKGNYFNWKGRSVVTRGGQSAPAKGNVGKFQI